MHMSLTAIVKTSTLENKLKYLNAVFFSLKTKLINPSKQVWDKSQHELEINFAIFSSFSPQLHPKTEDMYEKNIIKCLKIEVSQLSSRNEWTALPTCGWNRVAHWNLSCSNHMWKRLRHRHQQVKRLTSIHGSETKQRLQNGSHAFADDETQ